MRVKGFTLIEILVVVLIVGITLGFALLAFGDFGGSRRIIVGAEQFATYVRLSQQKAILESSTLGIRLNNQGYQVFRFQAPSTWQDLSKKRIFRMQLFPKDTVINLENNRKNTSDPEIIINASGDMTPFKLRFGFVKKVNLATVIATHNGQVYLQLATGS